MAKPGHNPRYDAGVSRLVAGFRAAQGKQQQQIADRPTASGGTLADGCWSCAHYANHGGNTNGTPPWSTCAFRLTHPECGRWVLSDHPWRFDDNWRETATGEKKDG